MVAELLELPRRHRGHASSRWTDGRVTAQREIEGGSEVVELKRPCVLTITKGAYEPRYASLKGIMAAKRKPLEEKPAQPGEARARGARRSRTRRSARPAASSARAPTPSRSCCACCGKRRR